MTEPASRIRVWQGVARCTLQKGETIECVANAVIGWDQSVVLRAGPSAFNPLSFVYRAITKTKALAGQVYLYSLAGGL